MQGYSLSVSVMRQKSLRSVGLRFTSVRAEQRFAEPLAPLPLVKCVAVWANAPTRCKFSPIILFKKPYQKIRSSPSLLLCRSITTDFLPHFSPVLQVYCSGGTILKAFIDYIICLAIFRLDIKFCFLDRRCFLALCFPGSYDFTHNRLF